MVINEIKSDIQSITSNRILYDPIRFCERANALDFIDFHVIDRVDILINQTEFDKEDLYLLKQSAEEIKQHLEVVNNTLFSNIRKQITEGSCRGDAFLEMIYSYTGYIHEVAEQVKPGYDNIDLFINGILLDDDLPDPDLSPEPGMVFYQQTPARIILDLIQAANFKENDVFYDLGSGLGHVPLLVNLITGTKCIGVEYEPAYCKYAKNTAAQLNITVEFINADARDISYAGATVVFLYTPFEGPILKVALELLQQRSAITPLRIFTYGPCSVDLANETWLQCLNKPVDDYNQLYVFKSR